MSFVCKEKQNGGVAHRQFLEEPFFKSLPGYGPVHLVKRPDCTRMRGVGGREKTRLCPIMRFLELRVLSRYGFDYDFDYDLGLSQSSLCSNITLTLLQVLNT